MNPWVLGGAALVVLVAVCTVVALWVNQDPEHVCPHTEFRTVEVTWAEPIGLTEYRGFAERREVNRMLYGSTSVREECLACGRRRTIEMIGVPSMRREWLKERNAST